MMGKIIRAIVLSILFLGSLSNKVKAQENLVLNPGFELLDTCPSNFSQIHFARHWRRPSFGSSDLFSTCDNGGLISVPNNVFGHQFAKEGNNYAGFYTFYPNMDYREYITGTLRSPLEKGSVYSISFWLCKSDCDECAVSVENIGIHFSENFIDSTRYTFQDPLPVKPGFETSGVLLDDTLNWVQVCGFYAATGNENFLTIGNFRTNAQTTSSRASWGNPDFAWGYYFVDNIEVKKVGNGPAGLTGDTDTLLCFSDSLKLFPGADISIQVEGKGNRSLDTLNGMLTIFGPENCDLRITMTYKGCRNNNPVKTRIRARFMPCGENGSKFYVPDIFTPNHDQINDSLIFYTGYLTEVNIIIYNRWGNAVRTLRSPFLSWDGKTEQGNDLADGIYFYLLTGTDEKKQAFSKHGTIMLLRQ